jgi:hypothetical protein
MSLQMGWAVAVLILLAGAHVRSWCVSPTFKLVAGMSTLVAWWILVALLAAPTAIYLLNLGKFT